MALEGSLSDFGLADILQLIYFQRKTGILTLDGRMDKVAVTFIEGNISGAESKKRIEDNRLGKILLKKGLITENELSSVLQEQKNTGKRLGQVLLKKNLVNKESVKEILTSQISETVIQLFDWKQGTYEFTAQSVVEDRDLGFSIDTQHLLMEGLRISDEWSMIRGKITLDTVFSRKMGAVPGLTSEEEEIFKYVDGENDVSTIIDLSGKDSFHVSKTLLGLVEKGSVAASKLSSPTKEEVLPAEKKNSAALKVLFPITVLVSLLISILVFVAQPVSGAKRFRAAGRIEDLRFRIEVYRIQHSSFPQNLGIISSEKDPWGRDYIYKAGADNFSLFSAGPDGKEGSEDDIY